MSRIAAARGRAALEGLYARLHEGRAADGWRDVPLPPRRAAARGWLTDILYDKLVPDGEWLYHHDYAPVAWPRLGFARGGIPVFWCGSQVVTTRGIEDVPTHLQAPQRLPPEPRALLQIGVLRELRFVEGDRHAGTPRTIRWPNTTGPLLAHDERGNLFALARGRRAK